MSVGMGKRWPMSGSFSRTFDDCQEKCIVQQRMKTYAVDVIRKLPPPILVDRKYRRHIPTPITVIRGRPHGDELLVEHALVALLY